MTCDMPGSRHNPLNTNGLWDYRPIATRADFRNDRSAVRIARDLFTLTDVDNGRRSVANAAVPAGFGGDVIAERFIGNVGHYCPVKICENRSKSRDN
jgi:hypothetical protein